MPIVLQCAQQLSGNVCSVPPRQPSYRGEEDDSFHNYLLGPPKAVTIVITS